MAWLSGTATQGMPYGALGSPDDPKSGCKRVPPALALASHAALRVCTGRPLMSACHTLSAGSTGQLGAAGSALAHAGAMAVATTTKARSAMRRAT